MRELEERSHPLDPLTQELRRRFGTSERPIIISNGTDIFYCTPPRQHMRGDDKAYCSDIVCFGPQPLEKIIQKAFACELSNSQEEREMMDSAVSQIQSIWSESLDSQSFMGLFLRGNYVEPNGYPTLTDDLDFLFVTELDNPMHAFSRVYRELKKIPAIVSLWTLGLGWLIPESVKTGIMRGQVEDPNKPILFGVELEFGTLCYPVYENPDKYYPDGEGWRYPARVNIDYEEHAFTHMQPLEIPGKLSQEQSIITQEKLIKIVRRQKEERSTK